MKKKYLMMITISILLISLTSISFAASTLSNNVKNTTNAIGGAVANTADHAKNALATGKQKVENGLSNAKNAVTDSVEKTTNSTKNASNAMANTMNNMDNNYNATRTSTDTQFMGMTSQGWTWLILGIVALAIVGLVWYYGRQYEHSSHYTDGE